MRPLALKLSSLQSCEYTNLFSKYYPVSGILLELHKMNYGQSFNLYVEIQYEIQGIKMEE
jgi:hypothetical protein